MTNHCLHSRNYVNVSASGKVCTVGEVDGFVKLLFGESYCELLAAHIIGAKTTEMIAELGPSLTLETTHEETKPAYTPMGLAGGRTKTF